MMNQITKLFVAVITLSVIIMGCSAPMSKKSYVEKYTVFINKVEKEHKTYSIRDWQVATEKFEKFNGKWNNKFADKLDWKEKTMISSYQLRFAVLKGKSEFFDFYNDFLKKDVDELTQKLKEYKENNMEEDIRFILKQAQEIGDSTVIMVEDIMKELEIEININ